MKKIDIQRFRWQIRTLKNAFSLFSWEVTCKSATYANPSYIHPLKVSRVTRRRPETGSILHYSVRRHTISIRETRDIFSRELISFERDAFVEIFERHAHPSCAYDRESVVLLLILHRSEGTISAITRPRLAIYLRGKRYTLLAWGHPRYFWANLEW